MRYLKIVVGTAVWLAVSALKPVPTVPLPDVQPGDMWVMVGADETHDGNRNGFRQVRQRLSVTNIEGDRVQLAVQAVGSPLAPRTMLRGRDWSNYVSVAGVDTLSAQPMNFPLSVGKHWTVVYETTTPPDRKYAWIRFTRNYAVTEFAPVTVAGGTFPAFRIEMTGHWQARFAPGVETVAHMRTDAGGNSVAVDQARAPAGAMTGGRLYSAIWYAPSVKLWVKLTEEFYGSAGVLSEKDESELEKFESARPVASAAPQTSVGRE